MRYYHLGLKILFYLALADGEYDSREENYIARYLRLAAKDAPGPAEETIEFSISDRPSAKEVLTVMKQFSYLTGTRRRAELTAAAYDVIGADNQITPEERGLFLALGRILGVDVDDLVDAAA